MTQETTEATESVATRTLTPWLWGLPLAAALWVWIYAHLTDFADLVVTVLGLARDTHLGEAVYFFLYDTPKILLLLTGVVFVMGVVQTLFAPERTRALLAGRRLGVGNVLAASLGIVTPFCCSPCSPSATVPASCWPPVPWPGSNAGSMPWAGSNAGSMPWAGAAASPTAGPPVVPSCYWRPGGSSPGPKTRS